MDRLRFAAESTRKRIMHSRAAPTNAVAGVPGRSRTLIIVRPLALCASIAGGRIRLSADVIKPRPTQDKEMITGVQSQTNVPRCVMTPGCIAAKKHDHGPGRNAADALVKSRKRRRTTMQPWYAPARIILALTIAAWLCPVANAGSLKTSATNAATTTAPKTLGGVSPTTSSSPKHIANPKWTPGLNAVDSNTTLKSSTSSK